MHHRTIHDERARVRHRHSLKVGTRTCVADCHHHREHGNMYNERFHPRSAKIHVKTIGTAWRIWNKVFSSLVRGRGDVHVAQDLDYVRSVHLVFPGGSWSAKLPACLHPLPAPKMHRRFPRHMWFHPPADALEQFCFTMLLKLNSPCWAP